MKLIIIVALALAAVAVAAPTDPPQIVRSNFQQNPDGGYEQSFETENGIKVQETGVLKEALDEENKPHTVVVVRGSYSYLDNERKEQTIEYYADETGFHAEGAAIPKLAGARR